MIHLAKELQYLVKVVNRMYLKVSKKRNILFLSFIFTCISCVFSFYMSMFFRTLFSIPIHFADIILSILIPAIITPLGSYILLNLAYFQYKSKKQMEELVNKDSLTDIYNRRYFEAFAEEAFVNGKHCTILLVDIDDFKSINDRYGHQAGDFVMKELAKLIKSQLRESDVVARIGGDEFAIICMNLGSEYGKEIAERIRYKIENTKFSFLSEEIYLTVSLGCVSNKDTKFSLDEFMRNADNALYKSKGNGKNTVTFIQCA